MQIIIPSVGEYGATPSSKCRVAEIVLSSRHAEDPRTSYLSLRIRVFIPSRSKLRPMPLKPLSPPTASRHDIGNEFSFARNRDSLVRRTWRQQG
jgi:hypothetical protein